MLKQFVELCGSIAHRVESLETMMKHEVRKSVRLVKHLVEKTDKAMIAHALAATDTPLVADTGGELRDSANPPGASRKWGVTGPDCDLDRGTVSAQVAENAGVAELILAAPPPAPRAQHELL